MEGGAAVLQPQKGFLRVRSHSPGAMRTVAWRRTLCCFSTKDRGRGLAAVSGPRTDLRAPAQWPCPDTGLISLNMVEWRLVRI